MSWLTLPQALRVAQEAQRECQADLDPKKPHSAHSHSYWLGRMEAALADLIDAVRDDLADREVAA